MVRIACVEPHSRAEDAGILADDFLLSINGNAITDVLDYRFYLADTLVMLECRRGEQTFEVTIKKGEYDDIGLSFETPLMDKKHSCHNACIFCFIDQLPKGMRETLYFKDDDSRLSFLHGNYITLTNLSDADVDRIIKMHISPINVSVHTTNPDLRVRMMKNKRAGQVLSYLDKFAAAGISICAQIVLCRGINDGAELDATMKELSGLFPALSSCSVVPSGLTKFRDGLYPLEPFSPEACRDVIRQVTAFGDECLSRLGKRLFFCGDEFYVQGGIPLPSGDFYEDYAQIENGVGMLTSLEDEFRDELAYLDEVCPEEKPTAPRHVSVATGVAAYDHIRKLCTLAEQRTPGLCVSVYKIVNHFFGESITVSGLLTGKDLSEQLADKALGQVLLLPANTLRAERDLFLCGMTPEELSKKLNVPIQFNEADGRSFLRALLGLEEI